MKERAIYIKVSYEIHILLHVYYFDNNHKL